MNESLSRNLSENTDDLLQVLSRFSENNFQQKPAGGGWSAAQIIDHLILFDNRTMHVLTGESVAAAVDHEHKFAAFSARLADRDNTIDAPESLIPAENPAARHDLIERFVTKRKEVVDFISKNDLSAIAYTPHRLFGPLSKLEWVQISIHHCMRHIGQLKELETVE